MKSNADPVTDVQKKALVALFAEAIDDHASEITASALERFLNNAQNKIELMKPLRKTLYTLDEAIPRTVIIDRSRSRKEILESLGIRLKIEPGALEAAPRGEADVATL